MGRLSRDGPDEGERGMTANEALHVMAYVGPDALMPLASLLAAIAGVVLVCWRWIAAFCVRVYRFVFRIPAPPRPAAADSDVPNPETDR